MLKQKTVVWIGLSLAILAGAGCEDRAAAPEAVSVVAENVTAPVAAKADCEPYFRFCIKAAASGAVAVTGSTSRGSNSNGPNCAEWAKGGAARVLELPTMLPWAGRNSITAALTRIGEYTGPGVYVLIVTTAHGNPDSFPSIDTGGRAFSNGADSTAVVKITADGSGSVEAGNLVEIKAAHRAQNPNPAERVNFTMKWTCQDAS
ncbi:MAG: hypothetical protein Q8L73_02665 [Methylotenera sp.]|nr:hypothetical protein [Methylotenera sp.]